MLTENEVKELKKFAIEIRIDTLKAIANFGKGHLGGAMSMVDALAVLYGKVMKYDPKNPAWKDRDWFICSKGHSGPSLYAALALKGFFPEEELMTLNQGGTRLPSHCNKDLTRGIDMSTGSLGQGSSLAVGIALGNKMDGRNNYTYLMLGDGEIQEGQVWEAALYAAQKKLDHLIAFVDYNKKQLDGYVKDINDVGDVKAKFEAFRWHAQEIDGNDVEQVYNAIEEAKKVAGKPSVIVMNTVKAKGIPFAEKLKLNHHIEVSREQFEDTLKYLKQELKKVV
ncbi:MAG: transketolase [Clostridium sp.]|jgi:transketolase|uniref:transketolase n=1 Tax=Clostridium sp. TaxID=1506 RepID=UPI0025B95003|nr:transketolase [Clostridium sp.]MCH3964819.1 transketolase [Clostridium sp.]MCI1715290.1 transketolase [Clostridium sp.]MCI1799552.1 transketolase [Clostridium sp.]MCI1813473.1 transketolase [Clostridium sp.]MCI1870364.1 transketolase [Clostridium sp.]